MRTTITIDDKLVEEWVDFFRAQPAAVALVGELADRRAAVVCGMVLQETLQGARTEKELAFLQSQLAPWHDEAEQPEDFSAAAAIDARLRGQGVTVPPADCLIAAVARRCDLTLAASDPHFARMAGLKFQQTV